MQLGYLVFEVRNLKRWQEFAGTILGCMEGDRGGEALGLRVDDAAYRLLLREGKADDIVALGWGLQDRPELARLADRLRACGVDAIEMSARDCEARGVEAGLRFADPLGLINEAVVDLPRAKSSFRSETMPGGFTAGDLGLGHAVLSTGHRAAELERFYIEALGLALTENIATKVGPLRVEGVFLHCNRRHHSLALIAVPSRKRLLHFMLQANRLRDVGLALERTKAAGIPLSLELGQHPDPDGTISFYAATPSGFDFEIGVGSGEIDPASHQPEVKTRTSDWGHAPSARLKLRGAFDLLVDRFRRAA
ncbi:MAG TPA: VOC family protein [Ferrovibrio sp.]|jgi:2,3-dihydroxybiphenyl 1,2-dioxygenase|uniref:VOC family protein n=1 Tax=Ferrovibrio sp. TaxID=1917215 RepID=UPI002ED3BFCE